MPSSVHHLLGETGLTWHSVTPWGTRPPLERPGTYLVSTSADPREVSGPASAPLSRERVEELLTARRALTVAGAPADADSLTAALQAMWPSGETVLFVGLAGTSVAHRVERHAAARLGARTAGWPLKLLADRVQLHVHVAGSRDPAASEQALLAAFVAGVSPAAREALSDPSLPLPFANLELSREQRKLHRIGGAVPPRPTPGVRKAPRARRA